MSRASWILWTIVTLLAFTYALYGILSAEPTAPCDNWARITDAQLRDCLNFRKID